MTAKKSKQLTINVTVDKELKDKLQKKADKANIKLSTYCRIKLIEAK